MAAAIKALNARIRANPVSDYLCSTHFWGPASNFGIPLAAVMDTQKDPEFISGPMTIALVGYSATFMRYALAVQPKNWLLFGCHLVNFSAQSTQGYRYLNYWQFGGREKSLEQRAKEGVDTVADKAKGAADAATNKAKEVVNKVKS
ncbi:UPF0041-domain-containing protein [Myriangium duriaei CBS 260.36]|uniref:Mitochondrial pyruvate carrier n=1 Tax=Myriangium duriaei CBS 260.36 TaxID=1168546 RepID=A0A9P4JBV3_9PEZI|nr:UPF0041-domain-containing protein [Myriangium duriaei CBS 260.36]